jgi:hypothetical protein
VSSLHAIGISHFQYSNTYGQKNKDGSSLIERSCEDSTGAGQGACGQHESAMMVFMAVDD